jgi:hypothetical protein
MRLATLFCVLLALAGTNVAQSTNFPTGPQYLVNGSPMFLRSIATPTLSLSTPLASPTASESEPHPQTPPAAGLPQQADLSRIYWGGSETADKSTGPIRGSATEASSENMSGGGSKEDGKDVSEINITSALPSSAVPPSILDTGVTGMTNAQSLRVRGFGVPLGDAASFWKTHKPHASRVYTNADIRRLRPS